MKYVFAVMDDETRYGIAQEVAGSKFKHDAAKIFRDAKEIAGKRPNIMITDGLPAYHDAFNRELYTVTNPRSRHVNAISLTGNAWNENNNKMERINGEIRDREKTMRGLKKVDTKVLPGMQIYHNYTDLTKPLMERHLRKHAGLLLREKISGLRLSRMLRRRQNNFSLSPSLSPYQKSKSEILSSLN